MHPRSALIVALALAGCPPVTEPDLDDDDAVIDDDDATDDDDDAAPVDSDGDGVDDSEDLCPGGDDGNDFDGDGTPAWCDPTPLQVGEPDDLGSNSSHAVNFLLGTRQTLAEEGSLQAVGVLGRRDGPAFRIAVYDDVDGTPGALLGEGGGDALEDGPLVVPVPEVVLPAGDYWLVAVYESEASIGEDGSQDADTRFIEHEFADPLPATWPEFDFNFPGARINLWMDVGR